MKSVLMTMVFCVAGGAVLPAFAESEADRTMRQNMEAAKKEHERRQADATRERMRDKTHDGVGRTMTGKDTSIGVGGGKSGGSVDLIKKF